MKKNYNFGLGLKLFSGLLLMVLLGTTSRAQDTFEIVLGMSPATCEVATDGTAYVESQTGGVEPLTYLWSDGQNFVVASNLMAQVYSVTVTDATGATATGSIQVELAPESVWLMPAVTDSDSCADCNGTIDPMASLGLPPYSYEWSDGQTGAIATGLCPGTYTMTVTDSQGCASTATATVGGATGTVSAATISTTDETTVCVGDGTDDLIDVSVSGGSGTSSAWVITDDAGNILDLPAAPPFNFDGAPAGVCQIWYVTYDELGGAMVGNNAADLTGCFALSNPIAVTREQCGFEIVLGMSPATCEVATDGTAYVESQTGGVEPLTYLWSDGQDFVVASNLMAQVYSVTVTDATGATATGSIQVELAPESVWLMPAVTDSDGCIDCNGTIDPMASLGLPPYSYEWSDGQTGAIATGLCPGTYTMTVTDSQGCASTATATVGGATGTVSAATISTTDETTVCVGDGTDDLIDVSVSGGSGTSSAWVITDDAGNILDLPAAPPFNFDGAPAGVCQIWYVTYDELGGAMVGNNAADLTGCFALSNPIAVTREECEEPCDVNAGTASTDDETSICIGDGIPDPITIDLDSATDDAESLWIITDEVGLILATPPGPTFDLDGAVPGICNIYHVVYSGTISNADIDSNIDDISGDCFDISNPIQVFRNQAPTVSIDPADDAYLCRGESLTLTSMATGDELTYEWTATEGSFDDATAANPTYTMMMPGTYPLTVEVTTDAGCTASASVDVTVVDLQVTLDVTDISECGAADGALTAVVEGAAGTVSYLWNTGNTNDSMNNLDEGTYSVVVTDNASGCTAEATVDLFDDGISIGDYVWYDNNENCKQDHYESGVAFVPVYLYSLGPDGIACTEDDVLEQSTGTDTDGYYEFECVEEGTYYVQFFATAIEPDYEYTCQDGAADDIDSDANTETGKTEPFTLTIEGGDLLTIDAGIHPICNDVNYGGQICCEQTICAGEVPDPLTSTAPAGGGGVKPVEYLWMCSDTPNNPGDPNTWEIIPNSNSADFAPGPVYQTKYYVRCARRAGCDMYNAESNVVAIKVVSCGRMMSFQAELAKEDEVNIVWTVEGDADTYTYIVERSVDGENWNEFAQVQGQDIDSDIATHLVTDNTPKVGRSFYRVKQIMTNGNFHYSQAEELMVKFVNTKHFAVYPNPARNFVTVENTEEVESFVQVDFLTPAGSILHTRTFPAGSFTQEQIDLQGLPGGTYFVRILYSNEEVDYIKVTKLD